MTESYIINCEIHPREGETPIIYQEYDKTMLGLIQLDGYIIMPIEKFNKEYVKKEK